MAETNKLTQNTMIVNDGIPGDNNVDSWPVPKCRISPIDTSGCQSLAYVNCSYTEGRKREKETSVIIMTPGRGNE